KRLATVVPRSALCKVGPDVGFARNEVMVHNAPRAIALARAARTIRTGNFRRVDRSRQLNGGRESPGTIFSSRGTPNFANAPSNAFPPSIQAPGIVSQDR